MPLESIPGSDLRYYLIAFDKAGGERAEGAEGLLSERVIETLRGEPVTDVFLVSHGWKGDLPAARQQYNAWIGAMAACDGDLQRMRESRAGFRPLILGLHWPSLPWGDEKLTDAVSFGPTERPALDRWVDESAERLADTPAARRALETIFRAALDDIAPPVLPPEVRDAYEVLNREAGLQSDGVGGDPGADRETFDPETAYQNGESESVSFGALGGDGILTVLRQLSFWKMKDRARRFGETGGHRLLAALQRAASPDVRFHIAGHSFGCIVASALLAGPAEGGEPIRPVHSVALVQGALSLWSYCSDIPMKAGQSGYFHRLVAGRRVLGPIITTQSEFDTAVGRLYPLAAGAARQVSFAPGELPKYGALGAFGARGPGIDVVDLAMLPADGVYRFEPGKLYNLESSRYICEGSGFSGAHSDIAKPEVARAVWQAAYAGRDGNGRHD